MTRLHLGQYGGMIAASAIVAAAHAQSSIPSDFRLHAIVGARIEIGDGRVIEKGNVVMRGATIVAVGPDAAVPPGAEIVDGKGLTVYPGFIDAYTTKGVKVPDPDAAQDAPPAAGDFASAFMRDANRKGIRPQFQARQALTLDDGFLRPYWNAGFTSATIAPSGGMISGQSTLVDLSGRPARNSVVIPQFSMCMAFDGDVAGSPNLYPSSLLGRMAQVRQAFVDARWYRDVAGVFASGGTQRPPSDTVLEALQPVLAKSIPATFEADTPAQIERALRVSEEFGVRPILVGGLEAFRRIDRIKASGASIILGLHFGKEPGSTAPKPGEPKDASPPEPPDRLAERKRLYEESLRNVQAVAKAGIPFAFSSRGSDNPKDFMDSVRKIVKAGLTRDAALRALTIDAAQICGVARQLGTLEVGKIANVVVMSGDFLDEKTTVKMTYIDGHKIDPSRTPDAPDVPRPSFGGDGVGL